MYILFPDLNPEAQQSQYVCRGEKCVHQLTINLGDPEDEDDTGTSRYYFQGEQNHNRQFIGYETAQEGIDTFRTVMKGIDESKQLINLSDFSLVAPKKAPAKKAPAKKTNPEPETPAEQPSE